MSKGTLTYYQILEIPPNAKHTDVGISFNRKMSALRRPDAPPNPRAEARLQEAFDVLSDLDRRAAYDEQLRAARLKPAFGKNHAAFAALFVVALGAGLFWYLRPQITPEAVALDAQGTGKSYQEIVAGATTAIGRLHAVDMSGQAKHTGIAFTVEEGVAVSSCQGLPANTQLSMALAPRVVPARVLHSNEDLGLCKLEVKGAGSWPLSVSHEPARAGDRVYTTHVGPKGELTLREAKVKSVKQQGEATVLQVSVPLLADHAGSPLLDIHGRVVAVANMPPGGKETFVAIPPSWGETVPPPTAPAAAPKADEAAGPDKPLEGHDDLGVPLETRRKQQELVKKIDPQRKERLEKAFRPPPTVPDDI